MPQLSGAVSNDSAPLALLVTVAVAGWYARDFPSLGWRPGETWAEEYVIFVSHDAQPGDKYPLLAGLFDPATGRELTAVDESGASVTPVIGRVIVIG